MAEFLLSADVIGPAVAGVIATMLTYKYKNWDRSSDEESRSIAKLETIIFGVKEMDAMEGMIEIIETHDGMIAENEEEIRQLEEELQTLNGRVDDVSERLESLVQRNLGR